MIRAAVVGLGRWGQTLVDSLGEGSDAIRFARAVARTPSKVEDYAAAKGIALGSDYDDMLSDPGIDAVVLATPHSLHRAQIVAAAKAVRLHDFIEAQPFRYETLVGERGTQLSIGQRQLLSFARALIADPRILVLDEATSSVDTETEQQIQEALKVLMQGRTSFVIAHRLSTIQNASQVIVMDKGRIAEHGTHAELLRQRGAYFQLYTMPFADQE